MRHKLLILVLLMAAAFVSLPEAMEEVHNARVVADRWATLGIWNGFMTAYAREDEPEACSFKNANRASIASAEEFRWHGQIAQGNAIEIKGINGNVSAEAATSNEVEVVADKNGRRSDPRDVQIKVLEHPNGVTICALYPSNDPDNPNTCEPGKGGHSNTRNNDVSVNFTVKVPQGVRFIGSTVNGEVEAESIPSDVEAYTVNGGINISADGYAQARTVNGSIKAAMKRANWTRPLAFETVNGDITLDLPQDLSTEFRAETFNGSISTDFPVAVQGANSRRHMSGTIGTGGRELRLKTLNGSIRLRRVS
ncbi:MAG: DUF4097 family beta strand repeat-containing protein [Pyrinomonadaceae bacterium]